MSSERLPDAGTLPSLPYVSHEILLVLNEREVHVGRVAESVNRDPALTARLVSMANSAFFHGQTPIYSVAEAIMRLGMNRVRVMAASIVLSQQLDSGRCPSFDAPGYWYQAMATAHTSGQLARYLPIETGTESAHLLGLMHSIGVLLMVHAFPRDMDAVLRCLRREPDQEPQHLERRQLGFDRYTAGAMLLQEWGLPDVISEAVRALPDTRPGADGNWTLAHLLQGSMQWVERDFGELPPILEHPERLPEGLVNTLRTGCLREQKLLRSMASLLAQ